ncbi:MAG: FGGY family carbohydrate kinase, partial [Burkholderiales bacterium]|nr:FGGY family carbohydrate kinase [Burkholderiales bacterium]
MTDPRCVVGIDVGTQSLKAVVADAQGRVIGEGAVGYRPTFPRPGHAEQDPHLWLEALAPAIGAALAVADRRATDVVAIGVAGQLDGCVPTDAAHRPLAPCLPWLDRRGDALIAHVPEVLVRERAGLVRDATHMAAKIAWFQRAGTLSCRPTWWHQPVSFVVAQLVDRAVIDPALASTTMLFGLDAADWDATLLDAFGVAREQLPRIAQADTVAGRLDARGAMLTGLPAGVPVAVGTGDDFAGPLGAGATAPGTFACSLGTAEASGARHGAATRDPDALVETHRWLDRDHWLSHPGWLSGGAVTWFRDVFGVASADAVSALAAEAPPGADGVLFVPALAGAMAPRWRADVHATFHGLTASHGRAHCARALLEGCAFAMRDVHARLRALGVAVERVRLTGGGARSTVWARIRADVVQQPVECCPRADTSPVGAAMLAAVAAGLQPDL